MPDLAFLSWRGLLAGFVLGMGVCVGAGGVVGMVGGARRGSPVRRWPIFPPDVVLLRLSTSQDVHACARSLPRLLIDGARPHVRFFPELRSGVFVEGRCRVCGQAGWG